MIVHIPLLLFLVANAAPSDAALFSRSSESLTRAAKHVRRNVIKRGSGLLEDMRLAYAGLRQQQQPQVLLSSKMYCTNNVGTGLTGGVGSDSGSNSSNSSSGSSASSEPVAASSSESVAPTATHTESGSSPSRTGTASSSSASSTSSPSSPWKVAQQWVSSYLISVGHNV